MSRSKSAGDMLVPGRLVPGRASRSPVSSLDAQAPRNCFGKSMCSSSHRENRWPASARRPWSDGALGASPGARPWAHSSVADRLLTEENNRLFPARPIREVETVYLGWGWNSRSIS